jgi:hypothetical protein
MKLSSHAYNLYHAFDQPGCAVCRLTAASVHGYLSSLMYEYVNKPPTHIAVRAARGFCPTHAWHIEDQLNATALGVAVLYEGVLRTLLDDMGRVTPDSGRAQITRATNALKPQGPCPACEHRDTVESHLLRNLLEHLDQDEFAAGLRRSAGLCLHHLRLILDLNGHTTAKALLLSIQQDIWNRLQQELVEYKRKSDYRFAHEEMGSEGDSSRRVIEQLSGEKGLR